MNAKDFVHKWLNQHRGFDFTEATPEEQSHFELILSDVCAAYLENERKEIVNSQIEKDIEIVFDSLPKLYGTPMLIAASMRKNKLK